MGSILQWGLLSLVLVVDVTYGVRPCFDAASSDFRDCNAGSFSTTNFPGELLLNDCGLEDDDIPELIACFDNFGRELIEALDLGGNGFNELPANLFDGSWPELVGLSIDENNLSSLPAGLFSELTNLEVLDLANNILVEIPEDAFDGLTELESLGLDGNLLTELPVGVFDGPESLQVLDLDNNRLAALRADVFNSFGGRFTILSLSENELTELPSGLFSRSNGLSTLNLDGNDLTTLPLDIFLPLTQIFRLDLSGNDNLQCVPQNSARSVLLPDTLEGDVSCGDVPANTCRNGFTGFEANDVCCSALCGSCGGNGCSFLTGGPDDCCTRAILESGVMCDDSGSPPCILSDVEEAITCSNGLPGVQSGDTCCSAECGTCGGTGCSGRPGGGEECCVGSISSSGVLCSESGAAPCIID